MHLLLNAAAFQAGWFASVWGAASGSPDLGPLVVLLVLAWHLSWRPGRLGELALAVISGILGFFFDTALVAAGVFSPVRFWMPPPWSPLWMVFLWINFATLVNGSLRWLRGRYRLAGLFGAIGGPAAYYAGEQVGATREPITWWGLMVLAGAWSIAVPLMVRVARAIERHLQEEAGA
ncbi:MAG: DUF2878 domain-containing protein [Rubrivivax sp.]|nr:DUF2878 domain-containing protein [Rubrivivax sp.]